MSTPKGDDMKQIEGQMSLFDFIEKPKEKDPYLLPCDTCGYDIKGCCAYENIDDYCVLGDKWIPKEEETEEELQEAAEHEEKLTPKEYEIGSWVEEHGKRVLFKDIQVNKCYIADYSTASHKWLKVVYVKWIKEDSVGYVDSPKGVKADWSWGNSFSALTREEYINRECDPEKGEAESFEWWYELPSEDQEETTKEKVYKVGVKGLCDDAYCTNCGDYIVEKDWLDSERCPYCNVKISWEPWHRANDEEMQNLFGENWHERFGRKLRNERKDLHESD